MKIGEERHQRMRAHPDDGRHIEPDQRRMLVRRQTEPIRISRRVGDIFGGEIKKRRYREGRSLDRQQDQEIASHIEEQKQARERATECNWRTLRLTHPQTERG